MSDEPDYIICLQCETPTYEFEWGSGRATVARCPACGNDDPAEFMTEAEMEDEA